MELTYVAYICYNVTIRGCAMKVLLIDNKEFTDFNPIDFGYQKCKPSHYFGPFIRKVYLLHYVSNGTGIFKNERNEYKINAGQAFAPLRYLQFLP